MNDQNLDEDESGSSWEEFDGPGYTICNGWIRTEKLTILCENVIAVSCGSASRRKLEGDTRERSNRRFFMNILVSGQENAIRFAFESAEQLDEERKILETAIGARITQVRSDPK